MKNLCGTPRHSLHWIKTLRALMLALLFAVMTTGLAFGQADQGTITGVVQDSSGAVVGGASVTLTSVDTGLVVKAKADGAGVYVFSPVKIGNYTVTASAAGFETTTETNLHLDLQQRLNVVVTLKPGAATETVTVSSEAPLMQTQESSVGQVVDTETINDVPLNGRNWVFIAQLSAGAVPSEGSRGAGKGDFNANGQRAEQNNFILDGVDNNVNVVDYYNGASFVAQPPPDGLAEFKVQTSNYSAEIGHGAGAVVNASLKSGTNSIHGSAWEYLRNTAFDTHDWDNETLPVPAYHENQFGATLGLPILRNKIFFFGDVQANRIVFDETSYESVPTALERAGDFSEILNKDLTGNSPVQLYHQSPNAAPVTFGNTTTGTGLNCMVTSTYCTSTVSGVTLNPLALKLLSLYPSPNTNGGKLYNNYVVSRPARDNTFQWDTRADWNIGSKDTAYSRFSYWHEPGYRTPPLGDVLDGGGFGDDGTQTNLGENFMLSETHIFTQSLTNEFRLGYNYLHTGFEHPNAANLGFAASLGLGGIPTAPLNGGLPGVSITGISSFGSPTWSTTDEHENVITLLDSVTKIVGNHALKAGVSFQSVRFSTLQPQQSRGTYNYTGEYTSNLNASNTGYGVADFLLDQQNSAGLSNETTNGDAFWYDAAFLQDDWRISPKLTLNLGVRWDMFQPYKDVGGLQASYNMTGPASLDTSIDPTSGLPAGSGSAVYKIPTEGKAYAENIFNQTAAVCAANNDTTGKCTFPQVAAADNVALQYDSNPRLIDTQTHNFAPRVGVAYSPNEKTAIRAGFGIFYGGAESAGYYPNRGENYPFQYAAGFPAKSCGTFNCPNDTIGLASGFADIVAKGFASDVSDLQLRGSDTTFKVAYTESYNLSFERSLSRDIVATASYVGNTSRHLTVFPDPNGSLALENPSNSTQEARPLPDFGGSQYSAYSGDSSYNALQTKVEKRLSNGYSLLATYTWSHVLDDAPTPLGTTGDNGFRQSNLIPLKMDWASTGFDTRHRVTFNAFYDLPFGQGRKFLNHGGLVNAVLGGWSTDTTWAAQTGNPFSVGTAGISTAAGGSANAIKIGDPFKTGGTFAPAALDVSLNPQLDSSCAVKTRTRDNWYNRCAFTNPWNPNDYADEPSHYIPVNAADAAAHPGSQPVYVTSLTSALGFLGGRRGQIYGPGYERVNMSIFKNFKVFREQNLQFRADIFNVLNTPSLGEPNDRSIDGKSGNITGPRVFQALTPDSRFFQLSAKYSF
jgi:Carboxypeptidase regulatory-like domain